MRVFIQTICFLSFAISGIALADKNSEVRLRVVDDKGGKIAINAVAIPNQGMVINHEGPWKLVFHDVSGVAIPQMKYERKDFDESISGFKVAANWPDAATQSGSIGYDFTVFVCTKAKDKCFRDVHNGVLGVKRRGP